MVLGGGVVVLGRRRTAPPAPRARPALGVERDGLLEGLDGGRRLLSRQRELAEALPQPRAAACAPAGPRLAARSAFERARQLVRQAEALGQSIGQLAQREQRGLVLRILGQRLLEQRRRLAHVAALGHQQRGVAPPLAALLGILDQVDEQRRRAGGGFAVARGPLQLERLLEQRDLLLARASSAFSASP